MAAFVSNKIKANATFLHAVLANTHDDVTNRTLISIRNIAAKQNSPADIGTNGAKTKIYFI